MIGTPPCARLNTTTPEQRSLRVAELLQQQTEKQAVYHSVYLSVRFDLRVVSADKLIFCMSSRVQPQELSIPRVLAIR